MISRYRVIVISAVAQADLAVNMFRYTSASSISLYVTAASRTMAFAIIARRPDVDWRRHVRGEF